MKKKIVTLSLASALAVTTLIGGTMAYFTDKDEAVNTFTYGNVDIKLVEKDKDGKPFQSGKKLLPGSSTVNQVVKKASVTNEGTEDAYMWIEVWVPAALDDGEDNLNDGINAGKSLYFDCPQGVTETAYSYLGSKTIGENNVKYNGYLHYVAKQTAGIKKGSSTTDLLTQVHMDKNVTQCTDKECENGEGCLVLSDGETHYKGPWELIINAVGFQSEGIPSIEEAIKLWYNGKALE